MFYATGLLLGAASGLAMFGAPTFISFFLVALAVVCLTAGIEGEFRRK